MRKREVNTRRVAMQNEKEKIEYWTESTLLKERGWSKGRITKLLKNPDKLVPNPHYSKSPKMRLYARNRVIAAEASPEFIAFKNSASERAKRAANQRLQRRQSLINLLSCPSVAPLAIYESIVTQRLTPFNENSFPEAFCRDMPEKLWLALSPQPEFEAVGIDIVVRIVLAALDTLVSQGGNARRDFNQVERIFEIWDKQLELTTGAGVEAFVYAFAEAIAHGGNNGFHLAERRRHALERLNEISSREWSVGPSFFQQEIFRDDAWLFFVN
jgi:hypothetical protein